MKDIRKYIRDAASIQHINCAVQKWVFRQPGRGPNPVLCKMMCEISANEMSERPLSCKNL